MKVAVLGTPLTPLQASETSASKLGGAAGAFSRLGFGARGMAIGNALTASKLPGATAYYNPASLPYQDEKSALLSFGLLSLDRTLNFVSYAQALPPTAGISFGFINAGVSNIDGRDVNGQPTRLYSTSENAVLFSFGTQFSPDISFGISAKLLYYSLVERVNSTTVAFDIGLLYAVSDEISVGLVAQDINARYRWDTSSLYGRRGNATTEHFPLRRRIALCYSPTLYPVNVGMELEAIGSTIVSRVGAELHPVSFFTLRAGIDQIDWEGVLVAKPSFGFALQADFQYFRPDIQYAFVIEPYAPASIHVVGIQLRF